MKPQQIRQKARKHLHGENAKVVSLARNPVALRLLSTPKDSLWVTHCGRREAWGPSLVPVWVPGPQSDHRQCIMEAKALQSLRHLPAGLLGRAVTQAEETGQEGSSVRECHASGRLGTEPLEERALSPGKDP